MTDPIYGYDVSEHQPGFDHAQAYSEGYRFVMARTSQGTYRDLHFRDHMKAIRKTKLLFAAYHYVWTSAAHDQAATVADMIGDKSVPVILDSENGSSTEGQNWDVAQALRKLGYKVILNYFPEWYWTQIGKPKLRLGPLWSSKYVAGTGFGSALYGKVPASYWDGYGGQDVAILQFTSKAKIAGQIVDASAFRGTMAELEALFGSKASPTPTPAVKMAPYPGPVAVDRALAMVGKPYGVGWCQKFTNEIFGTGPVGDFDKDNDADAVDGWKAAKANGKVVTADKINKLTDIPAGVMLYWTGGSHSYGHAAVAVGNGQMVSTDLPTSGKVGKVPITAAHDNWGLTFAGYVLVEGNGYTLLPATTAPKAPTPKPAPAPAPIDQEELDVATQAPVRHRSKPQVVQPTKSGGHKILYVQDNGNVSWAFGPGRYEMAAYIRFEGIDANDELLIQAAIVDTVSGTTKIKSQRFLCEAGLKGGDGTSFGLYRWRWNVAAPPKGQTRRLRISAQNFSGKDITITGMYVYNWKAPL